MRHAFERGNRSAVRRRPGRAARALRLAVLAGFCALLALPAAPAAAQDFLDRRVGKLQCVGCHLTGPGMARRFAFDPKTGERRDVTIDIDRLRGGDHADVACPECHVEGFERVPHPRRRVIRACMECHPRKEPDAAEDEKYAFERIKKEFETTVHYTKFKKDAQKDAGTDAGTDAGKKVKEFACEDCHEPHYFKAAARLQTPQQVLVDNNDPCLTCHWAGATGPLADAAEPNLVVLHAYVQHPRLHLTKTRCVDCHTDVGETVAHDLRSGEEANDCVACHARDSVMMGRHYRHHAEPEETRLGFANAALLEESYVMAATRHLPSDGAAYVLVGVVAASVAAHGTARIVLRLRRRRPPGGTGSADERAP